MELEIIMIILLIINLGCTILALSYLTKIEKSLDQIEKSIDEMRRIIKSFDKDLKEHCKHYH